MRLTNFSWLDREFVALSAESEVGLGAADGMRGLLDRFEADLAGQGLSLANTVRTRLFTRDRAGREQAAAARRERLSGEARSVSSSFVAPGRLASPAALALDLLAMRPSQAGATRIPREYEPPRAPLRSLDYDGLVFLSGVTGALPTLEEQVAEILGEIGESLAQAGTSWERVALTSCFLQAGQEYSTLRQLLRQAVPRLTERLECEPVDGFAGEQCLLEIEVTAVR
jgi:enamine deaminase RidA (YjgF/YER057c/UK114 family)